MSKQEPDERVKFLVSCIGHTSNGRPDFQAVADELDIVSKAAAQKRYERMLKAHGIKPGGGAPSANGAGGGDKTPAKEKAIPAKATKRKTNGASTSSPAKRTRTPRGKKVAPMQEDTEDDEVEPKTEKEMKQEESASSPTSSLSDPPPSEEEES